MDLPPEFWNAAGVIVAAAVAVAAGIKGLTSRSQEKERDRIAKEAHELAKQAYEAETTPKITVSIVNAAHFLGYGTVPEGDSYTIRHPDPFIQPVPMMLASIKNEGKIPVTIGQAGICLVRTGGVMELHPPEVDEQGRPIAFPLTLPPRNSFKIPVEARSITRMLKVLTAQPDDEFTFWVAEGIGTRYASVPLKASEYLGEAQPFRIAINFENPIIVTQIGEEEYYPDGIFLPETDEEPPAEPTNR